VLGSTGEGKAEHLKGWRLDSEIPGVKAFSLLAGHLTGATLMSKPLSLMISGVANFSMDAGG
jgi:hypothetical protein